MNEQVPTAIPPQQTRTVWLAVIGCGVALALCATVYQGSQTETLRRQMTAYQQDNDALRARLLKSDAQLQEALASLRQDVVTSKEEANISLTKAQQAALRHADLVAGKIAQRQQEQAKRLTEELGKVKESTDLAAAKLDGITSDVGSVKTDVGSVRTEVGSVRNDVETTKSSLEATRNELQRVRGDLGVMSGLVATNGKEIQMLRDLGDRNIYEFTLLKSSGIQKVGDVQVALRKTDMKHNRYTVDVLADDKRIEKKDKDTNEPVQFYASGARQPYELVINQVKKDQVIGYLATPKVTISRVNANASPAAATKEH